MRGQGQGQGHVLGRPGTGTATRGGTGIGTGIGTEGNRKAFTTPSLSSSLEHPTDYTAQPSPSASASPSASCLSCDRPLDQKVHYRHEGKIASLPLLVSTFEEEMSVLLARTQLDVQGALPIDPSHSNSKRLSKSHSKSAPYLSFDIDLDERYDTCISLTRPDPRSM